MVFYMFLLPEKDSFRYCITIDHDLPHKIWRIETTKQKLFYSTCFAFFRNQGWVKRVFLRFRNFGLLDLSKKASRGLSVYTVGFLSKILGILHIQTHVVRSTGLRRLWWNLEDASVVPKWFANVPKQHRALSVFFVVCSMSWVPKRTPKRQGQR